MPLGPFKVEYLAPFYEIPQRPGFPRKALLLNAPKEHVFPVAGISFRQPSVELAIKLLKKFPGKENRRAELIYEDDNKHDALAVAVYLMGEHVGYLPRKLCKEYRNALDPLLYEDEEVLPMFCPMLFVGGGPGDHIGIRLSLPNSLRASESRSRETRVGKPKKKPAIQNDSKKSFEQV